jgi:hypothetical protein
MPERLASPNLPNSKKKKVIATSWYHQFTNAEHPMLSSSIHGIIIDKLPAHNHGVRVPSVLVQIPLCVDPGATARNWINIPAKEASIAAAGARAHIA